MLQSVLDQIGKRLFQPQRIPFERRQIFRHFQADQRAPLAQTRFEPIQHPFQAAAHRDAFHRQARPLARLERRDRQQILDQPRQPLVMLPDDAQKFFRGRRIGHRAVEQGFEVAVDD